MVDKFIASHGVDIIILPTDITNVNYCICFIRKWEQQTVKHQICLTVEQKIMAFVRYLRTCAYITTKSPASQHCFLLQHITQRPETQAMLTNWPYAQVCYISKSWVPPPCWFYWGEALLSRLPGCGLRLPSSWVGVECLHVVDATMMMLQQYTVAQGLMCEARCGLRMLRMRPVLSFTSCMCVSVCVTPMEQYGMDPIWGLHIVIFLKDKVRFFLYRVN